MHDGIPCGVAIRLTLIMRCILEEHCVRPRGWRAVTVHPGDRRRLACSRAAGGGRDEHDAAPHAGCCPGRSGGCMVRERGGVVLGVAQTAIKLTDVTETDLN